MWRLYWRAVQLEGSLIIAGTVCQAKLLGSHSCPFDLDADPLDICQGLAIGMLLILPLGWVFISAPCLHPGQLSKWSLGLEAFRSTWIFKCQVLFQICILAGSPRKPFFPEISSLPQDWVWHSLPLPSTCSHTDRGLSHTSTFLFLYIFYTFAALNL